MGTWGISFFDNDDAMDWIGDLSPATVTDEIDKALAKAISHETDGFLDAYDCSIALAAAELVAAALGRVVASLPARAATLQGHLDRVGLSGTVEQAREALDIIESDSDLRDLWAGSGNLEAWLGQVDDLKRRLCV